MIWILLKTHPAWITFNPYVHRKVVIWHLTLLSKICLLRKVTNHAKVPSADVTQCRVYGKTVTGIQVHQHQQQQWQWLDWPINKNDHINKKIIIMKNQNYYYYFSHNTHTHRVGRPKLEHFNSTHQLLICFMYNVLIITYHRGIKTLNVYIPKSTPLTGRRLNPANPQQINLLYTVHF